MNKDSRIYVAGHNGMVGSALLRRLVSHGYRHLIARSRQELDLLDQRAVSRFFAEENIDVVLLAAAKVGGINANLTQPASFLYENLVIESNVIHAAFASGTPKLVFFGSSCIYPKYCPQPIKEDYLLTSGFEQTNEAYAIAKIAGLKLCEAYNRQHGTRYISVMPTNLYGPNDNYDLQNGHVLAALIRKTHEAKLAGLRSVSVWGSGSPRREFLHVDDLASAVLALLDADHVEGVFNIGYGRDISIADLAYLVCDVVGFSGSLDFDSSKPDGTPRKLLDASKLTGLGWSPTISLRDGIAATYADFTEKMQRTGYASA
ncbi:NAD-dependent epimerase/dehydratase family protein [Caballeronia novacaledonica]|uniref:GDP-L-fucose synthase family protein n=1 Tax=Caballeronia novacaledonica TaxID=1544861 RepID=UPI001EE3343F|nr:GDP-L-fucose synthase [Caballeronia novacaledonica]GJH13518.1 NAD-dependent epimerase/dehydratase family protein [Caballeronia novacaledonica]